MVATEDSASKGAPPHKKTPLFCCPGQERDLTEDIKRTFTGSGVAVPWPIGTHLRVKAMRQDAGYDLFFMELIQSQASRWVDKMSSMLTLTFVAFDPQNPAAYDAAEADIRIGFDLFSWNWSAVGPRAQRYNKRKATMNINLAGFTGPNRTVYSIAQVERLVAHMLGHALGLPHAATAWSSPWSDTALKFNGDFYASIMKADGGLKELGAQSIMQYDRVAEMGTLGKADDRRGGTSIDEDTRLFLRKLYMPPAYSKLVIATDQTEKIGTTNETRACKRDTFQTTKTANFMLGLANFEMSVESNLRLKTHIEAKATEFQAFFFSWEDTHLFNAKWDVLSFEPADPRIQTGFKDYKDTLTADEQRLGKKATTSSRRVPFPHAFPQGQVPSVIVSIVSMDTMKGSGVRLTAIAEKIDNEGFTLTFGAFQDTHLWDMRVHWLAHSPDDWTIRSGTWETTRVQEGTKDNRFRVDFATPMAITPKRIWRGWNYFDVGTEHNVRLSYDVTDGFDAKGFEVHQYTTGNDDSKYNQMKGCYIAIV